MSKPTIGQYRRIRTVDGRWYVCELRGACYVSWVSEADRAHAAIFPLETIAQWVPLLEEMTGLDLMFEEIYP